MPSAASSTVAPGHSCRPGSASSRTKGPSAKASPRSSRPSSDAPAINRARFPAAPLRLPFATSSPFTLTCRNIVCGSSSSTVTTHGPIEIGRPSAVSIGAPLASRARQSFTSV